MHGTSLSDYEYVHQCIKLEQDVKLTLLPSKLVPRPLARTSQDDVRDSELSLEDILPNEPVSALSHENLLILLGNKKFIFVQNLIYEYFTYVSKFVGS